MKLRCAVAALLLTGWYPHPHPQEHPYRTDPEIRALLQRLERNIDQFRSSLDDALDKGGPDDWKGKGGIIQYVLSLTQTTNRLENLSRATNRLEASFDDNRSAVANAEIALRRGFAVDLLMQRHKLTLRAEADWCLVRTTLKELAHAGTQMRCVGPNLKLDEPDRCHRPTHDWS